MTRDEFYKQLYKDRDVEETKEEALIAELLQALESFGDPELMWNGAVIVKFQKTVKRLSDKARGRG